jgi:hypothetical protein
VINTGRNVCATSQSPGRTKAEFLPWIEILQSNSETSLKGRTGLRDLPQKTRMVLDPVIEPIVLRFEPDQDTGGSSVPSDDDLFTNG